MKLSTQKLPTVLSKFVMPNRYTQVAALGFAFFALKGLAWLALAAWIAL